LVESVKVSELLGHEGAGGVGAFKGFDQVTGKRALFWSDEGDSIAFVTSSASSSDAMDVIFKVVRADVVHNELDVLNVEASGTDTCSNQDVPDTVLEVLNRELTVGLIHATMKYEAFIANLE